MLRPTLSPCSASSLNNYTAEIGYIGTRGIHLPTQIQLNVQPRVNAANQLPTLLTGSTTVIAPAGASTLAADQALSNIVPAFLAAGFTSKITSYQPYSSSNYNALVANVTRRFQRASRRTSPTPGARRWMTRRPRSSPPCSLHAVRRTRRTSTRDYSRSALDRTHRITLEAVYDLPLYKHSSSS